MSFFKEISKFLEKDSKSEEVTPTQLIGSGITIALILTAGTRIPNELRIREAQEECLVRFAKGEALPLRQKVDLFGSDEVVTLKAVHCLEGGKTTHGQFKFEEKGSRFGTCHFMDEKEIKKRAGKQFKLTPEAEGKGNTPVADEKTICRAQEDCLVRFAKGEALPLRQKVDLFGSDEAIVLDAVHYLYGEKTYHGHFKLEGKAASRLKACLFMSEEEVERRKNKPSRPVREAEEKNNTPVAKL